MVNHEGSGNDSVLDLSDQPSVPWVVRALPGVWLASEPLPGQALRPTDMSAFLIGGLLGLAVGLALRWLSRRSGGVSKVRVDLPPLNQLRPISVAHLARVPASRR